MAALVGIAKAARDSKEVGTGQMWGRISGFPSSGRAVEWAAEQFRKAGIADVRTQPITQDDRSSLWLPLSWRGDAAGRPGLWRRVQRRRARIGVTGRSVEHTDGTLTAPLVYVGTASPAVLQHIDVKGKIAVQLIVPQGHMLFERGAVDSRAEELVKRGAIGVFNLVRLPGNELSRDFSDCGNPCFNIGGRDGCFLESVLDRAAAGGRRRQAPRPDRPAAQTYTSLKAINGVAVIPGRISRRSSC